MATPDIRIGVLQTLSGPFAAMGEQHLLGLRVAADEINSRGGIGGRAVELDIRDTGARPDAAVAALRDFAAAGTNLVVGEVFAHIVEVVEPLLPALGLVNVSPTMTGIEATHGWFNRHFFRCGANGYMQFGGQAVLLSRRVPGVTRWGGVVGDYLGARMGYITFTDALRRAYRANAGREIEILDPILTPPGTTDFAPFIAAAAAQKLEGFHIGLWGGEALAFIEQARASRLMRGHAAVADTTLNVLAGPALRDSGPDQFWSACLWWPDSYGHRPMAQRFAAAMRAATGRGEIDPYAASAHTALMSLAAAIQAGGTAETQAVIAALETIEFESVYGRLRYRAEDHQLLVDPGFLRIAPAADGGYRLAEHVAIPVAEVVEPASPGRPFQEP